MKERLETLLKNAYAPYSNYQVATIVAMKDGQTFNGVNVENASYGASICAERNAINSAVAHGYKKGDFDKLYLKSSSGKEVFPCFVCRQVIAEFFDLDDELIIITDDGEKKYLMKDIIVKPFGAEDLK